MITKLSTTWKVVLIVFVVGLMVAGITVGILCITKDGSSSYTYSRPYQTPIPSDTPSMDQPIIDPRNRMNLGPLDGPGQQPNCGKIWNNPNPDYGLKIDPNLPPNPP
jgi:hypothetical protein